MLKNFKIRIAIWYAGLFTIIIACTLFASYKIISFQLKNEIKIDLQNKTNFVVQVLNGEHIEKSGEHSSGELEEHEHENGEQKADRQFDSNLRDMKIYTEVADKNYALFIFSDRKLIYSTPKYTRLLSHLSINKFGNLPFQDMEIEGIPFYVSSVSKSNQKYYIAYELSAVKNLQNRLLNIFLIVFPISLILSVLCGFVVTQKSLNIIKQIDDTAKKITSKNLGKRIEVTDSKDEISSLIVTLNSMIDRLEKSFTQAKQFSQDAAHEIRTPLTIIRGEIEELIGNEQGNLKTIKTLENVLEEVHYLSSISDRLLMIHNMDTNNIQYYFENINLSELIKEIYLDVQVLSLEKNIKVELEAEDNIHVNGNKELLSRLLWNIADNAIKYNNANGSVWIKLSKEGSQINIQVKDSGIGISDSEKSKIFNRFYRIDKSRSRQLGGSGLGLSICKWIAELHNGEINVESKEHLGSVFTIKIDSNLD